jgi:hypothetical protein
LLSEHEKEIRGCFAKGAHNVQIDFTEGRLAVKIDPSGSLLNNFIFLLLALRLTCRGRKHNHSIRLNSA